MAASTYEQLRRRNVAKQREDAHAAAAGESSDPVSHITGNTVYQSVSTPPDTSTDTPVHHPANVLTGRPPDTSTDTPPGTSADTSTGQPAGARAAALIRECLVTPFTPITLKVPSGINAYIDAHVRERWREKIKKQDVISRGFQLVIYELETGVPLVDLDAPAQR